MPLTFGLFDHQRKGHALAQALQDAGHTPVNTARADVLLVDFDGDYAHPRPALIEACADHGGIILVYPHGAYPTIQYADRLTADPRVVHLVQSPGVADFYRRVGMTVPVHVIGWYYCPVRPFRPVEKVERVLFCPAHPSGRGYLCDEIRAENARVFESVLAYGAEVQVTLLGSPELNGLWQEPDVTYRASDLNLDWSDIDQADLVVAEGTKGYMAVARGKPTVMFAQDYQPRSDSDPSQVPGWEAVAPSLRYPLEFGPHRFARMVELATSGGSLARSWQARMVGRPWHPGEFVRLVERLYEERR